MSRLVVFLPACTAILWGVAVFGGAQLSATATLALVIAGAISTALTTCVLRSASHVSVQLIAQVECWRKGQYEALATSKGSGCYAGSLRALQRAGHEIAQAHARAERQLCDARREHDEVGEEGSCLVSDLEGAGAQLAVLSDTMAGVSLQVRATVESAQKAIRLGDTACARASEGDALIKNTVTSMRETDEAARSISRIIRVIDDIAFQTNLLALNAAVEAARAGRHGKGFAVVAEEVRNLAARSGTAAKESSALIEHSLATVKTATQFAQETADAFSGILQVNTQFSQLVAGISSAAEREVAGLATMSGTLSQVEEALHCTRARAARIGHPEQWRDSSPTVEEAQEESL